MPLTLDSGFLSPELQSPTSATNVPMLGGAQASGSRSFGQSLAAQKASATAFFQSAAAAVGKTQPVTFDSFDDEFSAFTSPVESSNSANFDTSGSSLLSASGSGFDGFSSFAASPGLRTPSPPKLPAKITSTFRPPPPPAIMSKPPPAPVPVTKLRPPSPAAAVKPKLSIAPPPPARETHHQHTLSLMDLANSRKGKHWPAPPSPLPQALFPPPNAAAASGGSSGFDFLADDEESFGSFNSTAPPAAEGLLASNSSPAAFGHQPLLPSSSTTSSNGLRPGMLHSQSVSSAGSGKWLMGSQSGSSVGMSMSSGAGSLQSVPAAVPPGKKGPLTAQDLSFFEGL
ncbi:hypothetical protein EUX98_g3466 [Antrodiella citrinella]|uniref:Uncharacterized protein n=1 Tax=Antrodiella citrinella TaxID=2447956 RepID=A0A4S4MZ05_9APHY|nr:hypothetical protein EUX98_g3466 [Antrodiella citrinella]